MSSSTGARQRKTYAVTEAGVNEVQRWLRETSPDRPVRNKAILRVFLLWLLNADDAVASSTTRSRSTYSASKASSRRSPTTSSSGANMEREPRHPIHVVTRTGMGPSLRTRVHRLGEVGTRADRRETARLEQRPQAPTRSYPPTARAIASLTCSGWAKALLHSIWLRGHSEHWPSPASSSQATWRRSGLTAS